MKKFSRNKYKNGTLQMLYNQLSLGFIPRWFITYHYYHPYERVRPLKETNRPCGYKDRYGYFTGGDMWKQVTSDKNIIRKRKSKDNVEKDSIEIQRVILQYLFDIKKPKKYWNYDLPPLFFFHEQGNKEKQNDNFTYHTHLIMPDIACANTQKDLKDIFSTSIRNRRKCFSKWKDIDVIDIQEKYPCNPEGSIDYVVKETNYHHSSFDPLSSLVIHPLTKQVIPYKKNMSKT